MADDTSKKKTSSPSTATTGRTTRSASQAGKATMSSSASSLPSGATPEKSKSLGKRPALKSPGVYEPTPRKKRLAFAASPLARAVANMHKREKAKKKFAALQKSMEEKEARALQRALDAGKSSPTNSDYSELTDDDDDPEFEDDEDEEKEDDDDEFQEDEHDEKEDDKQEGAEGRGSQAASAKKRSRNKGTPSRKRTSPIWMHFEDDPNDSLYVRCKFVDKKTNLACNARIKRTDQSTSGLNKHIRQHKKAYADFLKAKAEQVVDEAEETGDVILGQQALSTAQDKAREILGKSPMATKMPKTTTLDSYVIRERSLTKYPAQSDLQKRIDLTIMTLIARCNLPLSIVDNPGFVE